MPLPAEWIRALRSRHTISISSTAALINRIQAAQAARGPAAIQTKAVAIVPGFDPPVTEEFRLIELLHALGEITTPPATNYTDLSATWAIIRYIWAFELGLQNIPMPLTLSLTARALDFHQKSLLSDQIGVGMAALIMKRRFAVPAAIDVSIALNDPTWFLFQGSRRSPDYLFHDRTINGPVFIVECKGNQSGRSETIHQLRSGTEQVQSVAFTNGRASTPLVIATWLKNGSEVFIIDPPEDRPPKGPYGTSGDSKATERSPRRWVVTDPERFSRDLSRFHAAQLLNFAGDFDAATRTARIELPDIPRPVPRRGRPAIRHNEFGMFEGRNFQISLPDGTPLQVFRGLLRSIRREILHRPEDVDSITRNTTVSRVNGITVVHERHQRRPNVSSVSDSGTMFELTIG